MKDRVQVFCKAELLLKVKVHFLREVESQVSVDDDQSYDGTKTMKASCIMSFKLTLPDLSLLLPTTLSDGGFSGPPTNS